MAAGYIVEPFIAHSFRDLQSGNAGHIVEPFIANGFVVEPGIKAYIVDDIKNLHGVKEQVNVKCQITDNEHKIAYREQRAFKGYITIKI